MGGDFDLFGMPVECLRPVRGRPQHVPCEKTENKIKVLLAFGWTNARIAAAVGLSEPTLRKHYFRVLRQRDAQRDRMTAEMALKLLEQGMAGNVASMKAFAALMERNDRMAASQRFEDAQRDDEADEVEAPEPQGKKARAAAAARRLSSAPHDDWGADLIPGNAQRFDA